MLNDVKLEEGLRLGFYCDDSDEERRPDAEKKQWYVLIDESSYRHESDLQGPSRETR